MKELSVEEKAKRYDEALKVLHKYDGANIMFSQSLKEEMFPELRESDDERIRKNLITYITTLKHPLFPETDRKESIAWLEKQGDKSQYWKPSEEQLEALDYAYNSCSDTERGNYYEGVLGTIIEDLHKLSEKQGKQKPDKVEPKFKVGDWVVTPKNQVYQITSIEGTSYRFNNESTYWEICYCDKQCHLWTIEDAKDGDVLVCPKYAGDIIPNIFIFKNINIKDNDVFCYCSFLETFRTQGYIANAINIDFYPATKEQRELLFKKMKEAGYEWDAEKKELKKIEQKPAWSEEDEQMIGRIRSIVEKYAFSQSAVDVNGDLCEKEYIEADNWLKSLIPQNH